jgi:transposase
MEEFEMSRQFSKEFKEEAARYYLDHKDLGLNVCAKNLGASRTALSVWVREAKANKGEVPSRGSGNYQSDEAKENAKLRKELRDTQDALIILKKAISILGN